MFLNQKIQKLQVKAAYEQTDNNKKQKYFVPSFKYKDHENYIQKYDQKKLQNNLSNNQDESQLQLTCKTSQNIFRQNKTDQMNKSLPQFKLNFHPETVLQLQLKDSLIKGKQKVKDQYIDISNYQFRDEVIRLGQKPFLTKFKPIQLSQIHDKDFDLFLRRNTIYKKNTTIIDPNFHSNLIQKEIKKTKKINQSCKRSCLDIRGLQLDPIKFE